MWGGKSAALAMWAETVMVASFGVVTGRGLGLGLVPYEVSLP
jgi:hypothetical protein